MRGRLQMLVDGGVTLPLIDQPIADTKFKAQLLHIPIIGIEMLMMHNAARNGNRVTLSPIVALAADLRIAVAFQCVEIGLGVRMTMTFGVRQVDKNRADRYPGGLEPVLFAAPSHQKIGRTVLRFIGFFLLLLVHPNAAAFFRLFLESLFWKTPKLFASFSPHSSSCS